MVINDQGKFFLANGGSTWITWQWLPNGVGSDAGAVWLQANPKPFDTFPLPSGTIQLETGRFQKRVLSQNGGMDWSYIIFVENTQAPGWLSTFFSLSGGGNS